MQNVFRTGRPADLSPASQQARDAALLRATTELFVQELINNHDAIRRYEALATPLLVRLSAADRAFVAERLSTRLDAPPSVIRALAKDDIDVARHVIRHSPLLGPLDLLTVIGATGEDHHRLISQRPGLPPEVEQALRIARDRSIREAKGSSDDEQTGTLSPIPAADGTTRPVPQANRPSTLTQSRLGQLDIWHFLGLDHSDRLKILADLAVQPNLQESFGPSQPIDRAFRTILGAAQIVGHARGGRRQELIETIMGGLELDREIVVACLDDSGGEAAAVLLKALGLDSVQAQQVFLLATPTIGLDVKLFFRLADIYAGMEHWVADALVDAWRNRGTSRPSPRHEPHFAEGGARRQPASREGRPDGVRPANDKAKTASA